MVTRDDVARAAGVSTAVVSYVINGGPRGVAPATAEKVRRAIEQLNYRPNGVARALVTNKSYALALIVPDNSNSFFAMLGQLIETAAFERGYTLLIGSTMEEPAREVSYLETFRQRAVDGFFLAPTAVPSPALESLATGSDRVVLIDRDGDRADLSRVMVDNEQGGYLATRHLVEHGHERIACITGPAEVSNARARRAGWQRAMRQSRLPTAKLSIRTNFSREQAYRATVNLLESPEAPTAIFATADEQALGVYRAAREVGIRIPDELAVVSFDSADTAPYLSPGLTAVSQPLKEMADLALERLLNQDKNTAVTLDVLPVQLVARGSCGCPEP